MQAGRLSHTLDEYSDNRYQFHQVGTGPFIFDEFVPGDRIVLYRNEDAKRRATIENRRAPQKCGKKERPTSPDLRAWPTAGI